MRRGGKRRQVQIHEGDPWMSLNTTDTETMITRCKQHVQTAT